MHRIVEYIILCIDTCCYINDRNVFLIGEIYVRRFHKININDRDHDSDNDTGMFYFFMKQ